MDFIEIDKKDGAGGFLIPDTAGAQEIADELLKDENLERKENIMARPKGSRNKKVKTVESAKQSEIIETPEEKPAVKDNSGLEDRPYFSVDEAARFLGVEEACARLWFDHGHLKGINDLGFIRISRASILGCRFRKLTSGPMM